MSTHASHRPRNIAAEAGRWSARPGVARRPPRGAGADNSTLWEIPEAGHVGGLQARPQEYERRVVGFFDEALGR